MKESDLCESFIGAAESYGWTCYPETSGWDILMVREGTQIGVQAKLRANIKVIAQCLPPMYWSSRKLHFSIRRKIVRRGPHYRTVLVPKEKTSRDTLKDMINVCQALGIWVFADEQTGWSLLQDGMSKAYEEYSWDPEEPEWIPDVVPKNVIPGASSPVQCTKWRQGALKLLARAKVFGKVTSQDAKELGVNMDLFVNRYNSDQWLVKNGRDGRFHTYELWPAANLPSSSRRPDIVNPEAFEYFVEELKKELNNEVS